MPPMPSEVRSASEVPPMRSTPSSGRAARMRGSLSFMATRHEMLGAEEQGEFSQGTIDVPRSNGEHGIAWPNFAEQPLDTLLQRATINHALVARGANGLCQCVGGDPANRRFIRGVDVRHNQEVRMIESETEVVPKVLRARKAMGLKEYQQAVVTAAARGF